MTLDTLTPNLMVEDVAATVEWYRERLDADVIDEVSAADESIWAHLAIDDVRLMFQDRESLEEELPAMTGAAIGGSFTMYVDVDDVEALSERLAEEARPLPMRTASYGRREFAVRDPNGYVLWFGEDTDE